MNIEPRLGVTYTGKETPFKDRAYKSELTFMPGQTRLIPTALAARFLRHTDVFQRATEKVALAAEQQDDSDDTERQLEAAAKAQEDVRKTDDAKFTLGMQIDKMDAKALREFAKNHFREDLPPRIGLENARDRVKEMVDRFGMP